VKRLSNTQVLKQLSECEKIGFNILYKHFTNISYTRFIYQDKSINSFLYYVSIQETAVKDKGA